MSRHFEILSWLDSGGFGDIYKILWKADGRILAAKRIRINDINEEAFAINETIALQSLQNPSIISLLAVISNKTFMYLIEELATFGNLECFYSTNDVIPNVKVSFIKQIVDAVNFCHSNKFAHLDINPSNVLVTDCQTVKLSDFGQAISVSTSRDLVYHNGCYLGDVRYVAPEVRQFLAYYPIPVDIWATGCLLLFVLLGKHLFTADDIVMKTYSGITKVKHKLCIKEIPEYERAVSFVFDKSLHESPDKRDIAYPFDHSPMERTREIF